MKTRALFTILPLLFLSGIFIPLGDNSPAWIRWVGRIFPVRHFADGMSAGFLGLTFKWSDVLIVASVAHRRPSFLVSSFSSAWNPHLVSSFHLFINKNQQRH